MKFTTKYDVGDTVFYLRDNVIRESEVCAIRIDQRPGISPLIEYEIADYLMAYVPEQKVFSSRKALIEDLKKS